jgi:hypothetical protein
MPTLVTRGAASVRGFGFAGTTPVLADPYFNYTTLLLHGNGTNGGQNNTFLDSGTANSGSGFTITRNGNTTQGTFSPFSQTGWSNYFNGGSDRISNASANVADFATNNFTVEMFVFLTSTADQMFFEGPSNNGFQFFIDAGVLKAGNAGTASAVTYTLPSGFANTWHHICVVREGTGSNQTSLYVDGVRQSQGTLSSNFTTTGFQISRTSSFLVYGYISNLRVVKGTAVYTAAFTPPTAPLTAISGTSLLICQSNRFVDNSGSSVALTIAGNTSVQAFSPFAPTAAYSASTVGGSGYFDGSGDYLSATLTGQTFGTDDFTVEFWVNFNSIANTGILDTRVSGDSSSTWCVQIYNNNLSWEGSSVAHLSIPTSQLQLSAWTHIAYTRVSGVMRVYLNGVQYGSTASVTNNYTSTRFDIGGAVFASTSWLNGYLSNVRLVKGTAVYTGNFTPPSLAPLTTAGSTSAASYPSTTNVNTSFASSATSLLLNFTNAAIIDNTAKNVLETVGNAQISTSVSKFGGGSLYFDGSGDYLVSAAGNTYISGTENFTIEGWLNLNSISSTQTIVSGNTNNSLFLRYGQGYTVTQGLNIGRQSVADAEYCAFTFATGTWYHIAVCRSNGVIYFFVNGTQQTTQGSGVASYSFPVTATYNVGYFGVEPLNGYLDDLRITKGIARYTSNFTPQTSQWQDQ